jgi:hypothetical protein
MQKIKYATERNGEQKEFPLTSQNIFLPNGIELALRYDHVRQCLTITKLWDDEPLTIQPSTGNQIHIK